MIGLFSGIAEPAKLLYQVYLVYLFRWWFANVREPPLTRMGCGTWIWWFASVRQPPKERPPFTRVLPEEWMLQPPGSKPPKITTPVLLFGRSKWTLRGLLFGGTFFGNTKISFGAFGAGGGLLFRRSKSPLGGYYWGLLFGGLLFKGYYLGVIISGLLFGGYYLGVIF